ncbi:ketoacyl-ACP synthase III [Paenibacillus physcomitrellae]|uniref:Beta-ketoacyl-[acyl-carrier-protein] synthase III n=1 Tax=Paenibacillus physcomitrellae TaxID=1619311 RepID=A0ABQ1FSQ7_9BACL|nr:ketoacyl-ACP synthase III [Paenibacillus physcomitrellae]GGA28049.1 3-oxoacyl-[acyl-carrier-protein] synthase 3 protein 2 [Paenibacillus physcomitrellae]
MNRQDGNFTYTTTARITAIGSYLPERKLTNADLENMVETSDEWIVQRTGIRERRIAAQGEFTSDMCFAAVRSMVEEYRVELKDVDYIIVATTTPDTFFPQMAARVQAEFGIGGSGAVDVQAACAGFVAALQLAGGLIATGMHRKILVIGAEALSKITDYSDRTTCILFGDGAGAVLVEAGSADEPASWLSTIALTDGEEGHHLYRSSLAPNIGEMAVEQNGFIVQNGRAVYRWAISRVPEGIEQFLAQTGIAAQDLDWFVPHNPNMRILEAVSERTGIPLEKTLSTLAYTGNTSAASIPIALHQAVRDGRIRSGQLLMLYGFGGGLSQAGLLLRWAL